MADFNITGEAKLGPIEKAIRDLGGSFEFAKQAVANLSADVAAKSGNMKQSLLVAQEAVKQFEGEVKLAVARGSIKGLSDNAKVVVAEIKNSLLQSASDYKLHSAAVLAITKELSDNDKRRTEISSQLAKDRQQKLLDEAAATKLAARRFIDDWSAAIKFDKHRTQEQIRNAKEIESNDRRRAALSDALTADRKAKAKSEADELVRQQRRIDQAHGQAITEDRKRASDAARNSAQIVAARGKEVQANNAVATSLKAVVAALSFQQIKGFIQSTIEAAISMDRVRNSLNAATGSLKDGGEAFDYVRKLAYGLGLDLQVLAKQYGLFIAASNDTGLSLGKQRAIFESIAEVTRSMGLSVEDMQGVFVALQQILTKGTLQMEELRQQLGDRLPGALRIMAKSLGITQKAMYDFTKKSVIESKEAVIQFSEEVRKALVDPTIETALASIQTRFNNLKNVTFELKAAFGAAFGKALSDNLDITQKKLEETKRTASALGEGLGQGLAALIPFVDKVYLVARSVGSAIQTIVFGFAAGINALIYSAANSVAGLSDAMGLDDTAKKVKSFADSMKQAMVDANDVTTESFRLAGEQMASAFGIGEQGGKKLSDQLNRTRISEEELAEARKESDRQIGKNQTSEDGMIDALRREIEAQRENNAALLTGSDLRADAVSKMSDEEKSINKMATEVWKETDAIEGNILSLTKKGVILQEAIRLAEQDGTVTAAASETIKQKVGEQYDAYERIGVAVPKWLQEIGAQYGAVSKAQQQFIDELTSAADKAEKRLTEANDKKRDSSGGRYGEMDLQDIEVQIADAKKKRDEAVSELLAATDAAGAKKAQKQVEEADKAIEDRIKRREEIRKKIEGQNAADAAPDNKKKEELQKQADALRSDIAALEAKQAGGSLSPEELDRLFSAKGALQDIKNEMGGMIDSQEQIQFGWTGITDGTDAATDAWEAYYALVDANAIKAKLALEDQANATDEIRNSAGDLEVTLTKVGDKWVLSNEAGKAAADDMAISVEKVGDTWKLTNESAEKLAKSTELASDEIGLLAIESQKLEDIEPMKAAAHNTASMEVAMKNIVDDHLPKMISLMGELARVSAGIQLGAGGGKATDTWQSDQID